MTIRVWAKDASGRVVHFRRVRHRHGRPVAQQTPQTGRVIASSLESTFAQVYDSVDQNVVYTVDRAGNFVVLLLVDDPFGEGSLGYVNIANGDRVSTDFYHNSIDESDRPRCRRLRAIGNISQIPDGAKYETGESIRSGNTYYYRSGAVLRDATGAWFHREQFDMQDATGDYWSGGTVTMQSGGVSRYPSGTTLKSGTIIDYIGGIHSSG